MEKYFFEAVKNYDRVNIPKVGSFSWNKGNLEFNPFSTYHDGKFLKYLKEELKWDNEKATSISSTWFTSVSEELNAKKSFMLKGYGTLLYQNDKIIFNKQKKYRKNKIVLSLPVKDESLALSTPPSLVAKFETVFFLGAWNKNNKNMKCFLAFCNLCNSQEINYVLSDCYGLDRFTNKQQLGSDCSPSACKL